MSASPPTPDVSLRCSEPTLRAGSGGRKPFIANWAPSLQNGCPIFRLTVGSAARQWAQGRGSTWTSPTQRLTDGKILATGRTARKVLGQDVKTLKDATGKLYGPDLYAAAKEGQITEARRGRDARCEDKLRYQVDDLGCDYK
jgi:hypothetical protein